MKKIWILTENPDTVKQLSNMLLQKYEIKIVKETIPDDVPDLILLTNLYAFPELQVKLDVLTEKYADIPVMFLAGREQKMCLLSSGSIRNVACRCVPQKEEELLSSIDKLLEVPETEPDLSCKPHLSDFQSEIHHSYSTEESGAIQVAYDSFGSIYNFVEKLAQRSGQYVQTLLLTLVPRSGFPISGKDLRTAMKILSDAVHISLRRNDVLTGCSCSQVLVLLMDADDDGGHVAANRILNTFLGLYDAPLFDLQYDIKPIEQKI